MVDAVTGGLSSYRPSSHYDESAQNASSRPHSPRTPQQVAPGAGAPPPPPPPQTGAPPSGAVSSTNKDGKPSFFDYHNPFLFIAEQRSLMAAREAAAAAIGAEDGDGKIDYTDYTPVTSFQRPESMTIPIGGVWRPGQSDDEEEFMKNLSTPSTTAAGTTSAVTTSTSRKRSELF